jgi:hypothetical protein
MIKILDKVAPFITEYTVKSTALGITAFLDSVKLAAITITSSEMHNTIRVNGE